MKKKILIIAILLIIPFMTACGKKEYKCTTESDGSKKTFTVTFTSDDKLDTVHHEQIYDLDKMDLEDYGCHTVENCIDQLKDFEDTCKLTSYYTNCNVSVKGHVVTVNADLTDSYISNGRINHSSTKEETFKAFEDDGFTCNK